jgi:hypothetical protein
MRAALIPFVLLLGSLGGCASPPSPRPVEVLDERTGVTLGELKEPIELVPVAQNTALIARKRGSIGYLGPVEWNRSGTISYGLWMHIAPAPERPPGDIHASGAVTLLLDDGPLVLVPIEAPKLGRDPYGKYVVSWGQTAYFDLSAESLRRMAASRKFEVDIRAADGSGTSFTPTLDTRAPLTRYAQARGIIGD